MRARGLVPARLSRGWSGDEGERIRAGAAQQRLGSRSLRLGGYKGGGDGLESAGAVSPAAVCGVPWACGCWQACGNSSRPIVFCLGVSEGVRGEPSLCRMVGVVEPTAEGTRAGVGGAKPPPDVLSMVKPPVVRSIAEPMALLLGSRVTRGEIAGDCADVGGPPPPLIEV